jgi:hypothetical protein
MAAAVLLSAAAASAATYFFGISAVDPASSNPAVDTPTPLEPFFNGAQALKNLQVTADATSAEISWQGDAMGFGKLEFGTSTRYGEAGTDTSNGTDHAFTLFGLRPATKYFYRLSNLQTIDGESTASITGSFDTLPAISARFLRPLNQSTNSARPLVNISRSSKVISVKVQLTQGGAVLTAENAPGPVAIAVSKLASCRKNAEPIPRPVASSTNELRFDAHSQAWISGLDPKALGLIDGHCYRLDVSVDGNTVSNAFAVFQPGK